MRNVTKKLIAKYNMYATKSDWVKYQFGKVHIIFAIITALAFGFVFGMDTERQTIPELLQAEHDKTVSETALYYSDAIEEYTEILHHYSGYISSANSVEKRYLRYMTKSALYAEIDRVNNLMQSFEEFGAAENPLYGELDSYKEEIQETIDSGRYLYPYTDWDYEMLAFCIWHGAGSSFMKKKKKMDVGCVVLNRQLQGGIGKQMIDPSIEDIINEGKDGGSVQYPYSTNEYYYVTIPDECYEAARRVLEREVVAPRNVLYQATFPQGEVYHSYYHPELGNTTYICYE